MPSGNTVDSWTEQAQVFIASSPRLKLGQHDSLPDHQSVPGDASCGSDFETELAAGRSQLRSEATPALLATL